MKKVISVLCSALFLMLSLFAPFTEAIIQQISKKNSFVLPASLKVIEEDAFSGTAVENASLPSSLTMIADQAFGDNPSIIFCGIAGTYAEKWAVTHGYQFIQETTPVINITAALERGLPVFALLFLSISLLYFIQPCVIAASCRKLWEITCIRWRERAELHVQMGLKPESVVGGL